MIGTYEYMQTSGSCFTAGDCEDAYCTWIFKSDTGRGSCHCCAAAEPPRPEQLQRAAVCICSERILADGQSAELQHTDKGEAQAEHCCSACAGLLLVIRTARHDLAQRLFDSMCVASEMHSASSACHIPTKRRFVHLVCTGHFGMSEACQRQLQGMRRSVLIAPDCRRHLD